MCILYIIEHYSFLFGKENSVHENRMCLQTDINTCQNIQNENNHLVSSSIQCLAQDHEIKQRKPKANLFQSKNISLIQK